MKKTFLSWGVSALVIGTLFTSCVAKKKYTEAQNTITDLREQNALCMQRGDSLNQSLSSLQQSNSDLQRRFDSTSSAYASTEARLNEYTGLYEKQNTAADQLHQQLHQQLDDLVGATNIAKSGEKIYVTLPEATLFSSSSTSLSSKGKEIINTLAAAIAQHPDVEVNVATSAIYGENAMTDNASAWNNSTSGNNNMSNANNNNSANGNNNTTGNDNAVRSNTSADVNRTSTAKKSTGTKSYSANHGAHKTSTAKKSSGTKYKSETTRRTMKSNYSTRKTPTASSSSVAIARASAVVSALRENGVQKAGIQVTDPKGQKVFSRKYQVIVSPSADSYYEMMNKTTSQK